MIFLIDPSDLTTLQACPKLTCQGFVKPCLVKPLYGIII